MQGSHSTGGRHLAFGPQSGRVKILVQKRLESNLTRPRMSICTPTSQPKKRCTNTRSGRVNIDLPAHEYLYNNESSFFTLDSSQMTRVYSFVRVNFPCHLCFCASGTICGHVDSSQLQILVQLTQVKFDSSSPDYSYTYESAQKRVYKHSYWTSQY